MEINLYYLFEWYARIPEPEEGTSDYELPLCLVKLLTSLKPGDVYPSKIF